jgi:AraC family transcriptional regulator
LYKGEGLEVRLSWYGPGSDMAPHRHDYHQASVLLAGRLLERHGGCDREIVQPSTGFKPAGLSHGNRYGAEGALILAVNFRPGCRIEGVDAAGWRWSPVPPGGGTAELVALAGKGGGAAADAVWDLVAGMDSMPSGYRGEPRWLARVRERLEDPYDEAGLADIAREAGVHRVHLSRSFQAHHAVPPSVYRAQHRVSRALGLMAAGARPAEAALDAGYADQAHLSRAVKRQTGLTPAGFGRFLAAA